ncbi:hypothetical protein ACFXKR_38035 [Streptomyces violascens]|uniref:hypothetical protein n=1 Tax=Streptomyces violascens TaxID=67381 RepID=UPI003679FCCC
MHEPLEIRFGVRPGVTVAMAVRLLAAVHESLDEETFTELLAALGRAKCTMRDVERRLATIGAA